MASTSNKGWEGDSSHDSDSDNYDGVGFSINAAKTKLKSNVITLNNQDYSYIESDNEKDEPSPMKPATNLSDSDYQSRLSNMFTCTMCLNVMYKPVTLSCGHSLCRACLAHGLTMLTNKSGQMKCPVCRKIICSKCTRRFCVNIILWELIQMHFPEQMKERSTDDNFKKHLAVLRGDELNANANRDGFELIRKETFKLVKDKTSLTFPKVYRNVVRDSNDYVMHVALCLTDKSNIIPQSINPISWKLTVAQCILEEDESNDLKGFPGVLSDADEDRCIIATSSKDTMKLIITDQETQNILHEQSKSARFGEVTFDINFGQQQDFKFDQIYAIRVLNEATNCNLDYSFMIPSSAPASTDCLNVNIREGNRSRATRIGTTTCASHTASLSSTDDEDDDSEGMDEYEDDGFIVMSGEESQQEESVCDGEIESVSASRSSKRIKEIESSDEEEVTEESNKRKSDISKTSNSSKKSKIKIKSGYFVTNDDENKNTDNLQHPRSRSRRIIDDDDEDSY